MIDKQIDSHIYQEFSSEFHTILQDELPRFKKLGIKDLGFRRFYKNGTTIGFTTNLSWFDFEVNDSSFSKMVAEHFQAEIGEVIHNHQQFCLRIGDVNQQSEFLKKLYEFGMWNTLALYKVDIDKIDGFYFISTIDNSEVVTNYINNLDYLRNFISVIGPKIHKIYSNPKYQKIIKPMFDKSFEENFLHNKFQSTKATGLRLRKDGKSYLLSKRELECLVLLSGGNSVKQIANLLKISPRTIEGYVLSLKIKINASSRSDLIKFAHAMQLTTLLGK